MVRRRVSACAPEYNARRAQRAGPWRAWRTAISGQGLWAATGPVDFPEDVGRGDAADAQAGEGRRVGAAAGDDEAHAVRRRVARFAFGGDADAAAAQLPGDEGGAVLVGEQLVGGEDEGRVGGDQRAQAGAAPASRRSGRPARWRERAASRRRRRATKTQRRPRATRDRCSIWRLRRRLASRQKRHRRAVEQRQEDRQRDQRGADLDRLGGRVGGAADAGGRVGERRGAEAGEDRRLAAAPAAADAVEQEDEGEGGAEVVAERPARRRRPGASRKSPEGQIPSASKGETWPKRLPRPGPLGSKVSKLWKSIMRPISGAIRTRRRGRQRTERQPRGRASGVLRAGQTGSVLGPRPRRPGPAIRLTANSAAPR